MTLDLNTLHPVNISYLVATELAAYVLNLIPGTLLLPYLIFYGSFILILISISIA
jgi:hypothetical protein